MPFCGFLRINTCKDELERKKMKEIEKKLFTLFDHQRFNKDKKLQSIIDSVERKYDVEYVLADSDLSFAIGGRKLEEKKDKLDEQD